MRQGEMRERPGWHGVAGAAAGLELDQELAAHRGEEAFDLASRSRLSG
jgi:hypothetical protein